VAALTYALLYGADIEQNRVHYNTGKRVTLLTIQEFDVPDIMVGICSGAKKPRRTNYSTPQDVADCINTAFGFKALSASKINKLVSSNKYATKFTVPEDSKGERRWVTREVDIDSIEDNLASLRKCKTSDLLAAATIRRILGPIGRALEVPLVPEFDVIYNSSNRSGSKFLKKTTIPRIIADLIARDSETSEEFKKYSITVMVMSAGRDFSRLSLTCETDKSKVLKGICSIMASIDNEIGSKSLSNAFMAGVVAMHFKNRLDDDTVTIDNVRLLCFNKTCTCSQRRYAGAPRQTANHLGTDTMLSSIIIHDDYQRNAVVNWKGHLQTPTSSSPVAVTAELTIAATTASTIVRLGKGKRDDELVRKMIATVVLGSDDGGQ